MRTCSSDVRFIMSPGSESGLTVPWHDQTRYLTSPEFDWFPCVEWDCRPSPTATTRLTGEMAAAPDSRCVVRRQYPRRRNVALWKVTQCHRVGPSLSGFLAYKISVETAAIRNTRFVDFQQPSSLSPTSRSCLRLPSNPTYLFSSPVSGPTLQDLHSGHPS